LVDCGNKHYEFSTIDCEDWQVIMTQQAVEPFDIENVRLFNKVHHAIATDESRSIYCNYHIRDGQLFTSDGFRAITTPINLADNSFAQKEFDSILRCLDGDVYYNFDDNIYFRCESDEFVIKYMTSGIEGEPFDAQKIFAEKEANEPLVTIVFDNLQNNLKDILVMQKQASKLGESAFLLTIRYDEFGLYFCTHITGLSNSEQKIDSDVTGEQFEFHINPVYLNDFAKVANGKITVKYIGPMGPILLYDESESKSLIMPMSKIVSR
jgi:DNA polymerase III sliding clamp (beta) subunit (PCNA family)